MTTMYEIYGFKSGDMQEIAKEIERALEIELEQRYGDNMNGDYYKYPKGLPEEKPELSFHLVVNADPASDFYMCDFAPECLLILNVRQKGDRSVLEPILTKLNHAKAELLERTVFEHPNSTGPSYTYRRDETAKTEVAREH